MFIQKENKDLINSLKQKNKELESFNKKLLLTTKELKKSEERFRQIFDFAPIGIAETFHGKFLKVNQQFCEIFGYSENELLNLNFKDLTHPADLQVTKETIKSIYQNPGQVFTLDKRYITKNGEEKRGFIRLKGIANESGERQHLIIVIKDITEQKLVEEALKLSEANLKESQKIAHLGHWKLDIVKNELFWSDEVYRIFSIQPQEFEANYEAFIDVVHPDDRELVNKTFRESIRKKEDYNIQHRLLLKNGKIKFVHEIGKTEYNKKGNPLFSVGTVQDITEQKLIDNELIKLNTAVEQSASSIIITDTEGNIEFVNKKFIQATGYSYQEVIGKNPRILKSGKQSDEFYKELWDTITSGKEWKREFQNRKKNGKLFWESITITPIFDKNKSIINYIAIREDITFKKKSEQKLLNAIIEAEERERKRFSEDLHDELGPFLSGIKLYIKELSYDDVDQEKRTSIINYLNEFINEAVEKIRSISNQLMPNILLDYGLVTALNSFCSKINDTKTLKVKFTSNIPEKGYNKTLEVIIYRISIELINNTIKHATAKKIEIDLNQIEEILQLSYRDDGKGFSLKEELKKEKGLGLNNILNRLNSIRGRYKFESKPGKGIKINIMIDLTQL